MKFTPLVTAATVTILSLLAPRVASKTKQEIPKETVAIPSSCAEVWQPLLHSLDDEYAIEFIYDPWYRVSFYRTSKSDKAIHAVLGGTYPWAGIQLKADPAASNACTADVYGESSFTPEVAAKIVAVLPGSKVIPKGNGKQGK